MPRDALVVITGPSGSGKSSLALDTIYTEGRRRFVESLSTYARQFLGNRDKPPMQSHRRSRALRRRRSRNLARASALDRRDHNEIHDHLRVLWARCGVGIVRARSRTRQTRTRGTASSPSECSRNTTAPRAGSVAPIVVREASRCQSDELLAARIDAWRAAGFVRILVDGVEARLDAKRPAVLEQGTRRLGGRPARVQRRVARAHRRSRRNRAARASTGTRQRGGRGRRATGVLDPRRLPCLRPSPGSQSSTLVTSRSTRTPEPVLIAMAWAPRVAAIRRSSSSAPSSGSSRARCTAASARYLVKGKGYYEYLLLEVALHALDLERPFGTYSDAQRALVLFGKGSKPKYSVVIRRKLQCRDHRALHRELARVVWTRRCVAQEDRGPRVGGAARDRDDQRDRSLPDLHGKHLGPDARCAEVDGVRLPELMRWSVARSLEWLRRLKSQRRHRGRAAGRGRTHLALGAARARRARLPHARSTDAHSVGRRGAARAALGQPRIAARGRVLRVGRAHGWAAPRGRREADGRALEGSASTATACWSSSTTKV